MAVFRQAGTREDHPARRRYREEDRSAEFLYRREKSIKMDQMKETIKKKQEGVEIIQRSVMFTHQLSGGCAELRLMVDIKAP